MTSPTAEPRPRRWLRRAVGGVLAAAALPAIAACGGGDGGSGGGGSGEPVRLGFIATQSGPVAFAGKSFAQGAEIAVQQLNAEDYVGDGRKLELEEKEGGGDPARAVGQMRQFVADKSVSAVFGGVISPVAGAISPLAKSSKLPYLIYGATEDGLEDPPYVLRSTTLPQAANAQLGTAVAQKVRPSSVAYAVTQDNAGMKSQLKPFKKSLSGVRDLGTTNVLADQTDLGGPAAQLIGKKPDAIVLSTLQPNTVGLITQLRRRGFDGLIVANETIASPGAFKAVGKPIAGAPFPVYFAEETANEKGKAFADAFRKKFDTAADSYAAQGYIAVYTLATAAKSVDGDVDRKKMTDALGKLNELPDTIYGDIRFEGGQLKAPNAISDVAWKKDGTLGPWKPQAR